MSWFKVDDSFVDHPKVIALQANKNWKGALALWTLAGSWCSKHLTDGLVPTAVVVRLNGTAAEAESLIAAGLWSRAEGGYQFHDWTEINPTRADVEARREATRERVSRHRAKHVSNSVTERVTNTVSNTTPVPSRPDPTEREGDGQEPAPRARPSSSLISALITGTRQAFESMSLPAPKQTRVITWVGWHELAAWCESKARLDGGEPVAIAQTLVVRFLRDKRAKGEGYPLPFLAQNPGQYWEAA